jgi:hypothetical protein
MNVSLTCKTTLGDAASTQARTRYFIFLIRPHGASDLV